MRIRLVLAVLFGLLFCILARLEVTELARPAEDTSNDYSRPHSEHETIFGNCRYESFGAADRLSNHGLRFVRRKWLTARRLLQTCWRGPSPRLSFGANKERI